MKLSYDEMMTDLWIFTSYEKHVQSEDRINNNGKSGHVGTNAIDVNNEGLETPLESASTKLRGNERTPIAE